MKPSPLASLALVALLSCTGLPAAGRDVVFAGYNIENYSPVLEPGRKKAGKSAEAADAVVQAVKAINPDILGVCEMGPPRQFEDFRNRLSQAGLNYTDFEFVEGTDPDRHLALVSRYPIVARQSQVEIAYECNGVREKVKRGFLDVTVRIGDVFTLRFVGAHLKSKRPSPDAREDLLRRNEAHLLHNRISQILGTDPAPNLVVYGDFNDTKDQPGVQEVAGRRGAPDALADLAPADSQGDRWTHYWKVDDVYSRIDYIFVNRAFSPRVVRAKCYVYRSPSWNEASDHRPVVATFHIPDK